MYMYHTYGKDNLLKTKGKSRVKLEAFWVRRVSRGSLSLNANVANILGDV